MNSNENDAMEWNDVLSETNILIYKIKKVENITLESLEIDKMKYFLWIYELGEIIQ